MKPLSVDNKARYSYRRRSEREMPIENKKNITNVIKIDTKPKKDDTKEKNKKNKLKEDMNEIEKVCTDKTLKKDLLEIYEKVKENNSEFTDKIFFKNLLDVERKVGKMDNIHKNKISHTFKDIKTKNILRVIENENSLLRKYTNRAKNIKDDE